MSFIGYLLVTSAHAYPTNAVSTANNPIFAFGGQTAASSTSTLATAPSDQKDDHHGCCILRCLVVVIKVIRVVIVSVFKQARVIWQVIMLCV